MNKKTMKKSLAGFMVVAVLSGTLGTASLNLVANASETEVGGIINADTTWTLNNSPYLITDTIQIPSDITLTIEPGVIINKSTSGDMFLLNGTIYAHGTADSKVTFDGGSNSNFFSAKNSDADTFLDLDYSIIRNGISFWPPTGYSQYGHFNLRHSLIENLSSYSYVWYPQEDVYIEYNEFRNSGGFSVGNGKKVYIRYNLFNEKNSNLPSYADYYIQNWASSDQVDIIVEYNSFIATDGIALKLPSGYNSAALTATNNYWGTQDTGVINSMIYDKNDDITCAGYIDYLPILTEPHPDTPIADISDSVPPVITLLGDNPVGVCIGDVYEDAGATALDDVDGDITADIVIGGDTVDTTVGGIYTVTYNVSDSVGNPAIEVTRTVNVNGCGGGSDDSGVCLLADGSLVRGEGTPEVYLIENGQKRWIVDPHAFVCLGYNWGDIISVSDNELNSCLTGENITAPAGCSSSGGGGGAGYFIISVTIDNLKTNDTTPELTGTINNNDATVTVGITGNEYYATNNGNETWTLPDDTVSELRIGIYDVSVEASYNQDYIYGWGTDNTINELTIKSDEEKPPFAVAIDNQKDARPVSGVNEADVVYEFPVEGSITRFMAIYNPDSEINPATEIGPVRSARPYFARTASEHKAIYAHAGGIPDALYGLNNHDYSVYNLDALYGGSDYFWRDWSKEMPHNLYTSIEELNNFRDEFELGNGTFTQPWIFSDAPFSMEDIGYDQAEVEVEYADINYNVKWVYDETDSVYYRQSYEDGSYQNYIDTNDNHISTENLAVQYANTDPFTEMWQIEGAALLCREGKCVNGVWKKDDLDNNVKFYLIGGEEFEFKTGKLWINVADATDTSVTPITDVTIENVSTENELRLRINWVNPSDKDLAKIFICRSNIYSNDMWNCGLAENLKGTLDNSVKDNYITPDSINIIDNFRLVEGGTYYYRLYATDTSGNWSEWSEEASGIPLYDQPIESGIRIDEITWIRNFGVTNNTYTDGWKIKFDITVNDPDENQLKFKMSDWTSNSNTIATIGNTKISLADLNTEAEIAGATSMGNEYSDMNPLTISDINPSMDKTQASFYVWIKLPTNTVAGNYRANYGIQTLTQ